MEKLAINGGKPIRRKPFPAYDVIGEEEKRAVMKVLDSGILSRFLGCWHRDFYGGPQVRSLEKEWAGYFNAKYAIAVNSCTSGLYAAVGAVGVGPGDEVIVSPYTMSASATAAVVYGAVPVFADIEEDCFCLDPASVEKKISKRTKAIIVVDIFGQPYDADRINALARKYKLLVIEDTAQAPGARYKGRYAGTLGDVGVFSLNYHKHIHCGEGGVVVTDDDELADRVRLIRNHAEAVVEGKGTKNMVNMVGFNFRMTEVEAAIARCQLRKLKRLVDARIRNCEYLADKLGGLKFLTPPSVRESSKHVFYDQVFKFDEEKAGVSRDRFIETVAAELAPTECRESEGVQLGCGYVKPLYLQPMYQKLTAFGAKGFPFKGPHYKGKANFRKGLCPIAERMYYKEVFTHNFMNPPVSRRDMDDVVDAFLKVRDNRKELK